MLIRTKGIFSVILPTLLTKEGVKSVLTKSELNEMKRVDISKCNKNDLADISTLRLDISDNLTVKIEDYVRAVKNPYAFRVGDVGVKINCEGDKAFSQSIIDLVKNFN